MAETQIEPKSLSEAIAKLEKATENKAQEFKDLLGSDYSSLRKAIEDIKPHLDDVGDRVKSQLHSVKKNVQNQLDENPWAAIAVVGVVVVFLGWLFSTRRGE